MNYRLLIIKKLEQAYLKLNLKKRADFTRDHRKRLQKAKMKNTSTTMIPPQKSTTSQNK